MYLVGTATDVRALHVMPGQPAPEGRLHGHDYRVAVTVQRQQLDSRGMVCDLDVLHAALAAATGRVRDRDLEQIRPAEAEAVTVEVFARWVFDQLVDAVAGADWLEVRIYESAVAFGGYGDRPSRA